MAYFLIIEARAKKELAKLPVKDRGRIDKTLRNLTTDPFSGKKLVGQLAGKYSIRVWPYRIVYEIFKKELVVLVIHVGQRQGIYQS
jgi:mRNA-degrading endonuclease RelE of RelBE toxin-antitoxin system